MSKEMDSMSRAQEEVRLADEAHLQRERDLFAAVITVIGSPGFLEFMKTIEQDRDRFRSVAEAEYESVLNPMPLKATACAQYAQSILDRVAEWRKAIEQR